MIHISTRNKLFEVIILLFAAWDRVMSKLKRCPCLRPEEDEVTVLDYRHCSLEHVPSDVFTLERTLEELNIDANQIRELPRVGNFYCNLDTFNCEIYQCNFC